MAEKRATVRAKNKETETKTETAQTVYQMVAPKEPDVKVLYIDNCISNNQVPIGKGRMVTGSGRIFTVSMQDFEGEFMTPLTMALIDERKFIVLDGLSDEQREQYNCSYSEGEVLKKESAFDYLIECETEKAVEIFSLLCKEHRALVGTKFLTEWENGNNAITRDKVEALNRISKENYDDGIGIFTPIVKAFAEKV